MRPGYCPHNPAARRGEDPPRRVQESSPRAPFLSPLFQAAIPPEALRAEIAKFRCFTPPDELYAQEDAYEAELAHQTSLGQ